MGKVKFDIPYAGYAVIWLNTAKGKIIFAAVTAALLAASLLMPDGEEQPASKKE